MSVDVAVIPAAGLGTRMRPATRVVPKALLTVVDRPLVQYAVEEAARAGVAEIFVVVDGFAGEMVDRHFNHGEPLPGLNDVELSTVVQSEPAGLGHAVAQASDAVGDRPFFCLLVDNIVRPGHDVLPALAEGSRNASRAVMCLRELTDEFLSRYGVVVPASDVENGYLDLAGAVEKPGPDAAPSRLGLVGRYVFTPDVFPLLAATSPGVGGEIQLTDAIQELGERRRLRGYVADEDLLDVGTPEGLVLATYELGRRRFGSGLFDTL